MTDHNLIINSLNKDRKSQKELFNKYAPYLLSIAQRYVNDHHNAEDVFLRTFTKIFENLHQYETVKGEFKYWAKRILINEALNSLRSKKSFLFNDHIATYDHWICEPDIITQLNVDELHAKISNLRHPYGVIFNMVIDGYSYSEISEILNIKESTCRSYYMRSKAMIKNLLVKHEYF